MKKIILLTVGVLLVIGLIGVGTFATFQEVEAGTYEPGPEFIFGNIVISPEQAGIGQIVTISVTVTNIEDPGTGDVMFKINDVLEETKSVELGRLESKVLTFTVSKDVAGIYIFKIISDTQQHSFTTGSFTVWEVPPTPTTTTPTTTTPTTTTPTTTTPTTTTPTTTTPTTTTPTTTTPTTTTPPPDDQEPPNWVLIGGIIAAVVVVVVLVFFLVRRKAA